MRTHILPSLKFQLAAFLALELKLPPTPLAVCFSWNKTGVCPAFWGPSSPLADIGPTSLKGGEKRPLLVGVQNALFPLASSTPMTCLHSEGYFPVDILWTLNVPFLTTNFPFCPPIFRRLTGTFSALILTTTFQSPKDSLSSLDLITLLQLLSSKQSMSWLSGHGCGSTQWSAFCFCSRSAGICYKN